MIKTMFINRFVLNLKSEFKTCLSAKTTETAKIDTLFMA